MLSSPKRAKRSNLRISNCKNIAIFLFFKCWTLEESSFLKIVQRFFAGRKTSAFKFYDFFFSNGIPNSKFQDFKISKCEPIFSKRNFLQFVSGHSIWSKSNLHRNKMILKLLQSAALHHLNLRTKQTESSMRFSLFELHRMMRRDNLWNF